MALPEDLVKRITAEAIGTFILVLVGTGAGLTFGNNAYAFGFALMGVMFAIWHISGAHVNPAVTVGLAAVGRFPMPHVPWYIGAQAVGALLASLFLRLVFGNLNNLGAASVAGGFSSLDGFLLELMATAVFVFVFIAVTTEKRVPAAAIGLAVGATLLAIQLLAGPITGGAVNPARALGPALASWTFADLWIYLTAPFIGAVLGAVGYEFIRVPEGWTGLEQVSQAEPRRSRPTQQRRAPAAGDAEPAVRPSQRQRPAQRPAYDQESPSPALYDEDELPPVRTAQRPAQQPRTQADPNAAPRPAQQRRRPPPQ